MKTATYARYSTDMQSEASIEDQLRVCDRLAKQHGFTVTARFSDAAISGGTATRPGYQAMLESARRREFDVIVAEDTSRLWRNLAEQAPRLAELADLDVHVVTHDLDTRSESAGILGAVLGASSEAYRKEIARRTRRGLEGLARNGKPTGGRAYGYVSATDSGTGQLEINQKQADVVRRIFELYAGGMSPRAIAITLNGENLPPPSASRARRANMAKGWVISAIAGSVRDGIGLLNNEIYIGRVIWNRFRWVRSAADSSRRRRIQNPRTEWIVRDDERLRIIPKRLWDRVKARQRAQSDTIGERVKQGLSQTAAQCTGRGPKYLFSGLLKCNGCGANFVMVNAVSYACASRVHGKPCANDAYVHRDVIEAGLLDGIRQLVLSPAAIEQVRVRVAKLVAKRSKEKPAHASVVSKIKDEVANLTEAVAAGALRTSPSIAARLAAAEQELERLNAAAPTGAPIGRFMPRLVDEYRELVDDLANTLVGINVTRARAEMRKLIGEVQVITTPEEIRLEATQDLEAALLRANGQQKIVVAGVGFEPTTFGL